MPVTLGRDRDRRLLSQQLHRPLVFLATNRQATFSRALERVAKRTEGCISEFARLLASVTERIQVLGDSLVGVTMLRHLKHLIADIFGELEWIERAHRKHDFVMAIGSADRLA